MTSIRLLIVDGAPIFRDGLRAVLETEDQIVVIGDTGDAAAAVRMAAELHPDVILMDLQLRSSPLQRATTRPSLRQ